MKIQLFNQFKECGCFSSAIKYTFSHKVRGMGKMLNVNYNYRLMASIMNFMPGFLAFLRTTQRKLFSLSQIRILVLEN